MYRKALAVFVLVIIILFAGYSLRNNPLLVSISTSSDHVPNVTFTKVFDEPPQYLNLTYEFIDFASKHIINVKPILQLPDYPTGCELISLAMDLSYVTRRDIDTDYFIDNYVTMSEDDFVNHFAGDPRSEGGSGCFPTAIVSFANKYLSDNNLPYTAREVSGISLKDIQKHLDDGFPILMWTTIWGEEPTFTGNIIHSGNQTYEWYVSEHCVLVKGYNPQKNVFIINDPLEGEIEYNISDFMEISDAIGNLAVVIK